MTAAEPVDLLGILDEFEPMREVLTGLVAAFVSDGFTEPQARDMVCEWYITQTRNYEPSESSSASSRRKRRS